MKLNMLVIGILILASCGEEIPVKNPAQSTSTRTGTAIVPKSDTGVGGTATSETTSAVTGQTGTTSATQILRHLPGTAVKLAGATTVYLVMDDATLAPFGSATALHTSGYADAMVVAITAAEFSCYGTGKTVKSGLPAPAAGHLRDGTLVKEKTKSTVYAVSDGIGWSIISMDVFTAAGYKTASVEVVSDGTIKNVVDEIGSCVAGIACLDSDYMSTCAKDEIGDVIIDPPPVDDTGTQTAVATSVATSAPTSTHTAEATSVATSAPTSTTTLVTTSVGTGTPTQTQGATSTHTAANTQTAVATQTVAQDPPQQTNTVTAVSTVTQTTAPSATSISVVASATQTATQTAAQTSVAASVTQTATSMQTAVSVVSAASATLTSTQTATQTTSAGTAAGTAETWVWEGDGAAICLNAAYFMPRSAARAVLRTWTGPYITGTNGGPITGKDGQNRFCWDFAGMPVGIYRLWADVPATSCADTDFCGDDGISGDGAQYGTAPNATAGEHRWLYCLDTGCDGYAVFNGTAWLPANL